MTLPKHRRCIIRQLSIPILNQKSAPNLTQKNPMNPVVDVDIDATGLHCPEPLMVVRNRMMDMASGQVVKVTATDPSTSWDLPRFCQFLHHELVHQECEAGVYTYWIRKG